MEYIDKIVDFSWCKKCKHEDLDDYTNPCHDCLNSPTNVHSSKPINFEEKPKQEK